MDEAVNLILDRRIHRKFHDVVFDVVMKFDGLAHTDTVPVLNSVSNIQWAVVEKIQED